MSRIPSSVYLLGLFVLALAVRLLHITTTDIAGDEPFSIFMAQFPISDIITYLNTGNNPPLFEILLHYYMKCVGDSDFLLRMFPTVCSALTVVPIFLIGDRFLNRRVAVAASLVFIFSIYNIRFAHEVRVYALFTLVFAWSLFLFLSVVKKPESWLAWLGLAMANTALLYSHYLSVYVLFTQGLTALLFVPKNKWKYLVGTFAITLLIYSPSLMVFAQRLGRVSDGGTWVPAPGWGEIYGSINLLLNSKITTIVILLTVFLGVRITAKQSFVGRVKSIFQNKFGMAILLWFALPYGLMFFVSKFYMPMFIDRYILFISVPLFLAITWFVDELWSTSKARSLGVGLIVLASVFTTDVNPSNNREITAATKQISELKNAETAVYIAPAHFNLAFAYHYNRDLFKLTGSNFPSQALDSALRAENVHFVNTLQEVNIDSQRIIYLDAASEFVNPNNGILQHLQDNMEQVDFYHYDEIFDIYVFETRRNR